MKALSRTVLEFVLLLVLGAGVAFAANAARTDGAVNLSRNYFGASDRVKQILQAKAQEKVGAGPGVTAEAAPVPSAAPIRPAEPVDAAATEGFVPSSSADEVRAIESVLSVAEAEVEEASHAPATESADSPVQHIDHPYQEISFKEIKALLDKPEAGTGMVVFVDARIPTLYEEGHIPGAIQVDHYDFESYVDVLLSRTAAAEKVIVYCNGGDCEDSLFMCNNLLELGLAYEAIYLYPGGWQDWKANAPEHLISRGG